MVKRSQGKRDAVKTALLISTPFSSTQIADVRVKFYFEILLTPLV
jgi:hypothetical protein